MSSHAILKKYELLNPHPPMRRIVLFVLFALLWQANALSQEHCDGSRYINSIFSEVDSTLNVKFGENQTIAGNQKNLFMDIYTPPAEFFFDRPLIILEHGGSFLTGNRKQLRQLCLEYARRGYVAATIDYRLFDAFGLEIDSSLAFDAAIKATMDFKAAIRWFKENAAGADDYGIDTNLIFIGGVSAGAIAADHCAYLDKDDNLGQALDSVIAANGEIRGNSSSNYEYSESVAGVLNFSGALKDVRWISSGEPPIFSMHDEFDNIVPYGTAITTEFGTPIQVSGSRSIHEQAVLEGIRSQLITIEGSSGHVSYFLGGLNTPNYNIAIDSSSRFLEYIICNRIASLNDEKAVSSSHRWYPNPTSGQVSISAGSISRLEVYDSSGRLVFDSNSNIQAIDLSRLERGIYMIRTFLSSGETDLQKIIVQ
jgi:para-nitrobenzyl esterase